MSDHYRATPEQWETIEKYADSISYSCILELRARIGALEAAQQPNSSASLTSSPADLLIDRVAKAIYYAPGTKEGCGRSGARAAILEVAAWLRAEPEGHLGSGLHHGLHYARRLEQEAHLDETDPNFQQGPSHD